MLVEKQFLELANRAGLPSFRLSLLFEVFTVAISSAHTSKLAVCFLWPLGTFAIMMLALRRLHANFLILKVENKYICLFLKPFSHTKSVFTFCLFPWMCCCPLFFFYLQNRIELHYDLWVSFSTPVNWPAAIVRCLCSDTKGFRQWDKRICLGKKC